MQEETLTLHKEKETHLIPNYAYGGASILMPYAPFAIPITIPEHDIEVSKPNGIMNWYALVGAVLGGVLAFVFAPEAIVGGTLFLLTAGGVAAGTLLLGAYGEKVQTDNYELALKQRALELDKFQEKIANTSHSTYKNISDLPEIIGHEQHQVESKLAKLQQERAEKKERARNDGSGAIMWY